ncbi:MAG: hypothetical protein ABIK43_04030, partial [candidate division WOR-3 bacterium]
MKNSILVVLAVLAAVAVASDLPYVQRGRPTGRGDPDHPTMELVWEANLPPTDVPPPYGTIVATWYINSGRSYDGAGIVWTVDSNRFFTVGQGAPSGQPSKVYSFDPVNPTGTIRDEAWDLSYPNLGGSTADLPWGIGYDPDSFCWWLTWLTDQGISNPCYALRFENKRWRGGVEDSWCLRAVEPPNWYSTFDKREDGYEYFIAHHVYSTLSAARFYKVNPYLKTHYGYYPNDVPPVSERAACWIGDTMLHMSTGGWNQAQFIGRDSMGTIRIRANCGSLASNDIWAPLDAHPDSTVWMFATYNDASNTVLKVSTGLTHSRLPARSRRNVGARAILAPAGAVDSGQQIVPQAVVRNMGKETESFSVFMRIGAYLDSQYVAGLPSGRSDTVEFNLWTANARESLTATAWTVCPTDSFPKDDTTSVRFLVRVKDVGITEILAPLDTLDSGVVVYPRAMVWNYGNVTAIFPLEFRIGSWVSTANVTLGAGAAQEVTAPDPYTTMPGTYVHRVLAALAGDLHPQNNVKYDTFWVRGNVVNDVGVARLMAPIGFYDTSMTVVPACTVANYGQNAAQFWVFMTCTDTASDAVVYADSAQVMLAPGGALRLEFRPVKFTSLGPHVASCSTFYVPDQNSLNNVKKNNFWVMPMLQGDVGIVQILQPPASVDTNSDVTPTAKWRNYSTTEAMTFTGYCYLINPAGTRVYSAETVIPNLAPSTDITITFPVYNVGMDTGNWVARCSTYAPGDTVFANDVLEKPFRVVMGTPWPYGWVEVQPVPAPPSGKSCKDGAWLA